MLIFILLIKTSRKSKNEALILKWLSKLYPFPLKNHNLKRLILYLHGLSLSAGKNLTNVQKRKRKTSESGLCIVQPTLKGVQNVLKIWAENHKARQITQASVFDCGL